MGTPLSAVRNNDLERLKKIFTERDINRRIIYSRLEAVYGYDNDGNCSLLDYAIIKKCSSEIIDFLLKKGCRSLSHDPIEDFKIAQVFVENKVPFNCSFATLSLEELKYVFESGFMLPDKKKILMYINSSAGIDEDKLDYLLEKSGQKITTDPAHILKYPCLVKYWDYTEKNFNELMEKYCEKNPEITKAIYIQKCKEYPKYSIYTTTVVKILETNNYDLFSHIISSFCRFLDYFNKLLIMSVKKGKLNSVKVLLEHKADIHVLDENGKTLLELAGNSPELVCYLIEQGARFKPVVDPKDLITAIQNQDIPEIKRLIKEGVLLQVKIETKTPLEYALETKNLEILNIVSKATLGKYKDEDEEGSTTTPSAPEINLENEAENEPGSKLLKI